MFVKCLGVLSGTTFVAYSPGVSMTLSQPTFAGIPASTFVAFFYDTDMNNVNFSAGRIALSTGTRSYSFDTSTKAVVLAALKTQLHS